MYVILNKKIVAFLLPTCSGDTDGSLLDSIEEVDDVSEHSSSINGSKVILGSRPLMMAPLIGCAINSSSIIISVSSP